MKIVIIDEAYYFKGLKDCIKRRLNMDVRLINIGSEEFYDMDRNKSYDGLLYEPYFLCAELSRAIIAKHKLEQIVNNARKNSIPIIALTSLNQNSLKNVCLIQANLMKNEFNV